MARVGHSENTPPVDTAIVAAGEYRHMDCIAIYQMSELASYWLSHTVFTTAQQFPRYPITWTVAIYQLSELASYWLAYTYNSTAISKLSYSSYCYQ
jgi:hypothetical protein